MKISNFRVRTQILLLFTPIIIFVIAILLLSYLFIFNYLETVFTSYSLELLIKETNNQLTTQLRYYDQRLKTIITQIFRKQNMFLNTYLFVDINYENIQIDYPIFCPSSMSNQDSKSIFCLMAYQYDDSNFTELESTLKKQFTLIALFHSLIFMFDNSQFIATGIAYTTNDNIPILGTWPALNSTLSYNAHQRSWYKSHIQSMSNGKQYEYSDLFTTILGSYTIAISQNITNKQGKYEGIVFNLIDFNSFKKNFNANYILANPKGQIIIGQFNYPPNTTNPIFFFNETVTGYNQNDWDSILLGLNNSIQNEILGNCDQDISIYLCRQNSLYNQDTLLIYQQLTNPPFPSDIVIILKNMSEIYIQIESLQSDIKIIFTNYTIFSVQIMFSASVVLFIIFNITLNKITIQLKILIKYTKFQQNNLEFVKKDDLSKQKISQILLFEKYQDEIKDETQSDNALDQLRLSYFQLIQIMKGTQGGFRKTDICFDFENRQYPRNRHNFKIQNINRLADYMGQINEKYLQIIINFDIFFQNKIYMGNLENGCLSRNSQTNSNNITNRPSVLKRQYASEKLRNQFLYPINVKEILNFAKSQGLIEFNPYSRFLTQKIIQLSKLYSNLDLSLCRFLLISQKYDSQKIGALLKDNQEFRQTIRPIENGEIRDFIQVVGVDFYQGLVIRVKIDKNNLQLLQQYFLYFLEYLLYEIAINNNLNNHIVIIYDLQFESINSIFLNFVANLTYQHYFLNIRKLILININLEKVSSEVIGMLNSTSFSYFILPLSDISYLLRHIKKSELSKEYGGTFEQIREPIPLTLKDAINFRL